MAFEYIHNQIASLTFDWYLEKIRFFKRETFYDPKLDGIFHSETRHEYYTDENNLIQEDVQDMVIDLDLLHYSWNDRYPYSLRDDEHFKEVMPINSSSVSSDILRWLAVFVERATDNSAKYTLVSTTVREVQAALNGLIETNNGKVKYIEVLQDFMRRFRSKISAKYGYIKVIYTITTEDPEEERLTFTLNQEELAALMFILNTADVIKAEVNDLSFLDFCSEHFYFQNQKQKRKQYTRAIDLRKKYSDARKKGRAVQEVIEKLETAIISLKKK